MGEFRAILPQGAGYAIICGLGAVFTFGMILTTQMLRRYQKEIMTAEEFTTAGRSVKTGLVASAVVSSWVWASTLLTSCSMEYNNGIFGGYSYSAGASFQIIAFSILAIKTKQKAPNAHTYLEIVKARYGKLAHSVYLFYAFATNILVTAMLLTSGSAVFGDLTGMNPIAAAFLLPLGVVIFTMFGGIRATFLTDYIHTCAIIIIILFFAFRVYATSDLLRLYILSYPENIQEHHETLFPPPQPSVPVRSDLGACSGAPPGGASITEGFYINTMASPMMCE